MIDFERETEKFVEKIRQPKVCQEYFMQKEQVKQYPGLKQRIDDYRKKNYRLQNEMDSDALFDEIDRFEREYEDFRKNPVVSDFLAAELAFCRMCQEITEKISIALAEDFDYLDE